MPSSSKTPAPSQRFLPLSTDHVRTPKISWHKPRSARQAVRFSDSTLPTSTQFASLPHFGKVSSRVDDDIDTSFENESSPLYMRHEEAATRPLSRQVDPVDDEDAVDWEPLKEKPSKTTDSGAELSEDGALGDLNLPSVKRPSSKFEDLILEVPEEETRPVPSKRRRTSLVSTSHRDAIITSSSEDNEAEPLMDVFDSEKGLAAHRDDHGSDEDDRDMSVSPSHVPSTTSSRFRMPAAQAAAAPSSKIETVARKMFKFAPPQPKAEDCIPSSTALLPDTFSPSRRRGKKDYLPGGSAETVRNWVLDLAATESKAASDRSHTLLRIVDARGDVEGRCTMVADEDHVHWLLVGQGGGNGAASLQRSRAGSLKLGDTVDVRTAGTAWDLGLLAQAKASAGGDEEAIGTKDTLNISVLWNVRD